MEKNSPEKLVKKEDQLAAPQLLWASTFSPQPLITEDLLVELFDINLDKSNKEAARNFKSGNLETQSIIEVREDMVMWY